MRISIALASYNGEQFIREQLDSLAGQTRLPDEVVICDDGSTDRTLKIIEKFRKDAPFPVHIHRNKNNLGFGDNFLKAASLCIGDWIAFCDQDDVWLPQKLGTLENYAINLPADVLLICHKAEIVDSDLQLTGIFCPDIKTKKFFDWKNISPWWIAIGFTSFFHKSLIQEIPFDNRGIDPNRSNSPMSHDQWITRLAAVLGKILLLPELLAFYRRHDSNTTSFPNLFNLKNNNSKRDSFLSNFLNLQGYEICESYAIAAHAQGKTLNNLSCKVKKDNWKINLKCASANLETMSNYLQTRVALYKSESRIERIKKLLILLKNNGYSKISGGVLPGAKAFCKDTIIIVLGI